MVGYKSKAANEHVSKVKYVEQCFFSEKFENFATGIDLIVLRKPIYNIMFMTLWYLLQFGHLTQLLLICATNHLRGEGGRIQPSHPGLGVLAVQGSRRLLLGSSELVIHPVYH